MLQLKNITRTYITDHFRQNALDDVSINFEKGTFTAILGESGSGKSTLLNIISGLDKPTKGEIYLDGIDLSDLSKKKWAVYRNHYVGFIFQEYNLISHLRIIDNVALPLLLQGVSTKEAHKKAMEKLEMLDLTKHAHKLPNQLSGGQQQRVSIARALVTDPKIIMADEPTGALDEAMGKKVLQFIKKSCPDKIIIMVTHDEELANEFADRIVTLSDGKIINDTNVLESNTLINNDSMSFKKPKMPLGMEFKFSLNNLLSRMGRTIFTSLTVSIGLISIFLLVFLMTGVNKTINSVVDELVPENVYSLTKDTNTDLTESDLNNIRGMDYVDEVVYDINFSTNMQYLSIYYYAGIYNLPDHKYNFIGNSTLRGNYVSDSSDAIITTALLSEIRNESINSNNIESNFNIVKDDYVKVGYSTTYDLKIVGLVESSIPAIYVKNEKAVEIADGINYKMNANIYFSTTDKDKIDRVVTELEDNNYIVTNISVDIKEAMDNFFGRAKKILVAVASVSLVVSGILVGLIVYTSVIERIKEIGILTAVGAKPSNIMQIFIFESGLIGLFSVIIAFILSVLFSLLGNRIFGSILTSLINVLGFSTRANIFRIDIIWTALVFILCIVFTSLVGIIPAYKASRLNAVNTLRRE